MSKHSQYQFEKDVYETAWLKNGEPSFLEEVRIALQKDPAAIRYFRDLFASRDETKDLETVAEILVGEVPDEDAVRYLTDVKGRSPQEFIGFDGFEAVWSAWGRPPLR